VGYREYGVAVVGAGSMGGRHLAAIQKVPWFRLRVVCDANAELARTRAQEFGVPDWTSDFRRAVARGDVAVAYVCTPAAFHADVAIEAARNGKHVLTEKPLALTLDEGERMIEAARAAGVKLAVGFQHRFREYFAAQRRLFANDEVGRPVYYSSSSATEVRPNLAMHDVHGNGGPFVDVLCHYVDIWRFLFDSDPVRVFASAAVFAKGKDHVASVRELAPDTGVVVVGFASGDVGSFQTSWGLPVGVRAASHERALAPDALLDLEPFSKFRVVREGGATQEFGPFEEGVQELQDRQTMHFAEAVRDDKPVRASGEDGLIALKVSLAVLESAETGRAVDLV